ncbi:MAG: hypothetical protein U9R46_04510 [Bacteroidota bacterium]|nr:hypothetical protein [Bacteroidota bacterium]
MLKNTICICLLLLFLISCATVTRPMVAAPAKPAATPVAATTSN